MQPMAETAALAYSRRFFFLYDSSKVQEEEDRTREGIYYFSPEDTPVDQQELLCGQLAGVCRCVSEMSSSPVRLLRLRKSKYAVRMKDSFLWALSCVVDIPDVSVCDLLDQLIALFCFYNGPVRQSYQVQHHYHFQIYVVFCCTSTQLYSKEDLALRWARYLCHLQGGSTELHNIFSCVRTIDSTHIDPLLLLKAALILQACQRCPLVLAGCILYRGRSHCSQPPCQPSKSRFLSRTLSDTPTTDTDSSSLDPTQCPPVSYQTMPSSPRSSLSDEPYFSPIPSRVNTPLHSNLMNQSEYFTPDSHDHGTLNGTNLCAVKESLAGLNIKQDTDASSGSETKSEGLNSDPDTQSDEIKALANGYEQSNCLDNHPDHDNQIQNEENKLDANNHVANKNGKFQGETEEEARTKSKQVEGRLKEKYEPRNTPSPHETLADTSLVPSVLYQHRVRGLVLALLHHSSMASLNGLEAHLRNTSPGTPGTPGPPGPYTFAHYDCIQNTLTTNVCGRSAGPQEAFVRATKLLHSHFSHLDTLQEAIVRNGSSAVYGTRSMAQETYFLQQGTPVRNSGSPDPQDSAFSLPRKARQRLLKHGVNLL
ncbi:hypothetical protein cypCar_00046741 [Cyprinus carpio]|nr:hypothetical protein cypCar_00046741 [Cyprinus carpio]